MAKVNICDVDCVKDVGTIKDNFMFKITFECFEALEEDIEWKLIYVSSAYKEDLDQTLDSILVGPIPIGKHQFILETGPPDLSKIPKDDIVGVTVVLIKAFYREKEFIRVGYYVNNEYTDENLKLEPPSEPILDKLSRQIISSDPRVTRFPIDWGDGLLDGCPEPEQDEVQPENPMKSDNQPTEAEVDDEEDDEEEEDDDDEDEESEDVEAEHDVECSEDDEEDEEEVDEMETDDVDDEKKNENNNPNQAEANKTNAQAMDTSDSKTPFQELKSN